MLTGMELADVLRLPGRELRALLAGADPVERVWAAWALGLALGADAVPAARGQLDREPVAGVRRHLVTMLGCLGEWTAVEAFAVGDPDVYVRAAAIADLHRCGRSDVAWRAFADDPCIVVRERCLDVLGPTWPEERIGELVACAVDRDLREVALRWLAERSLSVEHLSTLAAVLSGEADRSVRRSLWTILLRHGRAAALRRAARERPVLQLELLQLIGEPLAWWEVCELDWSWQDARWSAYVDRETVPLEILVRWWDLQGVHTALQRRDVLSPSERRAVQHLADNLLGPDDSEPIEDDEFVAALARHGFRLRR